MDPHIEPSADEHSMMDEASMNAILEEFRIDHELGITDELSTIKQLCIIYRTTVDNPTTDEHSIIQFLPTDIFKLIFDFAVESCKPPQVGPTGRASRHEKLQQAIIFACVSRGWRAASLKIPTLWNSMCISVDWNAALVRKYWTCVGRLVEKEPVSLVLYDVCDASPITLNGLNCSQMKFSHMQIHLKHPDNVVLFPPSWQGCEIETMTITVYKRPVNVVHREPGEPFELEHLYAEAEALTLQSCHTLFANVGLTPHAPLLHLFLRRLGNLDTEQLFRAFPRLETLDIIDCSFRRPLSIGTAPELQILRLADDWFVPMEFPKLCELSYEEHFTPQHFGEFLKAHQMIKTLAVDDIFPGKLQIAADCARKVTVLRVTVGLGSQWLDILIAPGAFPELEQLEILAGIGVISPVQLDTLLQVRYLRNPKMKREEGAGQEKIYISWSDEADK